MRSAFRWRCSTPCPTAPGALAFFRTVLAVYLRQMGHDIPNGNGVLDIAQPPSPGELEDAYARYAGNKVLRLGLEKTAYPNISEPEPFYTLNVTMGFLTVDALKVKAKEYGASITEYLPPSSSRPSWKIRRPVTPSASGR